MIILFVEYKQPINFFGYDCQFDWIYFLSEVDLINFINGVIAYDYLDNCVCLKKNERCLYAVDDKGVLVWYGTL